MICKKCNGKGYIYTNAFGTNGKLRCDVCGGNGKILSNKQNNEEWFCGLSTEDKAEWLSKHFHCGDCIFEKPMCGGEYDGCKSAFVEWLKEKHDGSV